MATQPTNLPVPSETPRDLKFNAGKIDEFVTSMGWTYTDRFGVKHYTVEGIRYIAEQGFAAQLLSQQQRFDYFIQSSGYKFIGEYTSGPLTISDYNQLIRYENELWKLTAATSIPFTTTGNNAASWVNDSTHFVSVGDAALRQELAASGGAGLVGGLPVYVTATRYAGGASTTSTNNDAAITAAIADAIATGNSVYWPSVYEVQGNIPNFHSVRHDGPGGIKRGGDTYRVHPLEWSNNTLYVTAGSAAGNDGLSAAFPMSGMQKAFDALKSAGPVLNGTWNITVGAGAMTEPAIITAIQSVNAINISGPVVSGQPTAEINVTGQSAVYALWFGNGMRFKLSHMLLRGARDGSGLASGIVLDAGTTGHLVNVWTRDCEQNGVNANIRCRLLVEGGDYEADATSIRMYGNTTGFVGWNNVRVKVRKASRGVHTDGSSYSHVDYTDFINTAYGNVSEAESHATNYNNTFDGVTIGWEARSNSSLNTTNPVFVTPPIIAKGRALIGLMGVNSDFDEINRDTRNIQFYPYLGGSGRTAFGYKTLFTPSKTYMFSGDGLPSIADWSVAAGVNFVLDWGTPAASNYLGLGAGSTGFSGVAFGDETNPIRGLLRHQAGSLFMSLGGTSKYRFTPSTFGPMIDNDLTCGASAFRIKEYFGVTGAINTSDAREKTAPAAINDAVLDAWGDVQFITFQWLEAIRAKGEDSARWHFGVIAQQVRDAFIAHGLDGTRYGLLCYDEWEDKFEPEVLVRENPETGDLEEYHTGEMTQVMEAGNRWGIRPDQCLFLEAAYHRRRCDRIEARLEKLEGN
ncbi:tail fiber domain-containing protein [Escherichia coli]|nr:tail fiber domain-containing protein [Escherichia coli]